MVDYPPNQISYKKGYTVVGDQGVIITHPSRQCFEEALKAFKKISPPRDKRVRKDFSRRLLDGY